MYSITVSGHFDAAHRLPGVEICERLHGHSFQVECKVSSETLNDQGMVIDFRKIKGVWKQYDHRYLNDVFEMPTAENIAMEIFHQVKMAVAPALVEYVRVWESPDAYAEVRQ